MKRVGSNRPVNRRGAVNFGAHQLKRAIASTAPKESNLSLVIFHLPSFI